MWVVWKLRVEMMLRKVLMMLSNLWVIFVLRRTLRCSWQYLRWSGIVSERGALFNPSSLFNYKVKVLQLNSRIYIIYTLHRLGPFRHKSKL